MGMFDYVNHREECPNCDRLLTESDWQSKSGDCRMRLLEPSEVDNFYTSCLSCQAWIEYNYDSDLGEHVRTVEALEEAATRKRTEL